MFSGLLSVEYLYDGTEVIGFCRFENSMKPEVVTYHVIANANFTPCCVTGRIVEGKMADASNVSGAHGLDLHETRKRLEVLDKNYRNLKGLSQKG